MSVEREDAAKGAAENRSKTPTSVYKIAFFTSLFVAALAVVVDRLVIRPVLLKRTRYGDIRETSSRYDVVDEEVISLFVTYDENLDGFLDLSEFVKVANRILHRKAPADDSQVDVKSDTFAPDWSDTGASEQLTLTCHFTPLVLSTMTKYSDDSQYAGNEYQLEGLKSWTNCVVPMATYPVNAFATFLPYPVLKPSLGQPWHIVESMIEKNGPGLTSNRYYPTPVRGRLAILYHLLTIFHPRPFLLTRFPPQGTVACVRAESQDYLDIVFRVHAEFQLNKPPLLPFWFTPGQFLGNIVIKKDGSHVQSFHLAVPSNRSLNVDMEWLVEIPERNEEEPIEEGSESSGNMEVDIGFLPRMELQSTMPSVVHNEQQSDLKGSSSRNSINWDKEISFEEANRALEAKFYSFKKVPYLTFQDAITKAKAENKLVHHILLWGALDDQSC